LENIKKLTKLTLTELKGKNLPSTPENYFIEFKKQAKVLELKFDEIIKFDKIKSKASSKELKDKEIKSYIDLLEILSLRPSLNDLNKFAQNIDEILSPSIDFNNDKKINSFINKISKSPKKLLERDSIKELKDLAKDRIKADREILKKKTDDIIKLTSLMGKYFDKSLLESTNSSDEIHKIKDELEELNISNASHRELGDVQRKLVDTIYNIEKSMEKNRDDLSQNKEKFEELNKHIEKLQKELTLAKKEKSTDYLTGVLNRRAFDEELEKIEKKHNIFKTNYAVVFYDIDHFKTINDTHGHTCGDAVLRTFGGILKALTRKEDIIARYGGEEFVALINYEKEKELVKYSKRVKDLIKKRDFIYKDININLTYSAGISFRSNYNSYEDTKKRADELLYKAKSEGRDKILFDDGKEI